MQRKVPWIIAASLLLYRWLLRLGPDEFYDQYAGQALQVFRQCCLDAYIAQGKLGVLRLWPGLLNDTLKGMLLEQSNALARLLRPRLRWPIALALVCMLFPFFWLSRTWPLFGSVFNFIFSTPLAYFMGHVVLFCVAGLSILLCLPALRRSPQCYILCLMAGAFAEELIQILFNAHPGIHKDARNLLLDLCGILLAYLLLRSWQSWRSHDKYTPDTSI
jgi:hypothetical protein